MGKGIKTRKMGDRFKVDGITYCVAEPTDAMRPCSECAFCDGDDCTARIEIVGLCYKGMRYDDKQAIFKKVTEESL